MHHTKLLKLAVVALVSTFGMLAAPLTVSSYTMLNGAQGSFNYRDFTYTPCAGICDTTGAPLSGGTGKLTDGISPVLDWYQQGQNTQWVGWDSAQGLLNPVVTFFFSQSVTVNTVTIWTSNSLSGGVGLPSAVIIGGTNFAIVPDPVDTNPRDLIFNALNFTGSSLTVQLNQSAFQWVMVGEVSFDGNINGIPEPASLILVCCALPLLAALRRR
ncbi:MAG: hypothetical protein ACKV2U_11885 [Bryobacteraceae bacterium]